MKFWEAIQHLIAQLAEAMKAIIQGSIDK